MPLIKADVFEVGMKGWSTAVLLECEGYEDLLPIFCSLSQGLSIFKGLKGKEPRRPLTHELFLEALGRTDTEIEEVAIDNLRGKTFYAKLKLSNDEVLDARPSDCIAWPRGQELQSLLMRIWLEKQVSIHHRLGG